MEPLPAHGTSGPGSGAAVCIRLGHCPFCLVLLFSFLLLLFYLFGTFINYAWPSSVLSTEFKIQFVFRVPHLCRVITEGRREPREFNVEL